MGCTTLIVAEAPYGTHGFGLGIEEFVADGVIVLRRARLDGRLLRELEVLKMRGTALPEQQAVFTLKDGFKVFPPFRVEPIGEARRFKPQPDTPRLFSTGSSELDRMLGGGYSRGSSVLLEIDEHVSTLQYHLIVNPTGWNFLAHGRAVIVVPSAGVDPHITRQRAEEGGFTEDEINSLLRICVKSRPEIKREPYIVIFGGEDIKADYMNYLKLERMLMEMTGRPLLHVIGVDMLIDLFGEKEALSVLKDGASRIRKTGSLGVVLLKPGLPEISKILGAVADVHLKITREHGSVIVYGIKPRTGLHVLEMSTENGYPMPKITPIY